MVYPAGITAPLRTHARHMELAQRVGPESDMGNEFFGVHEGPIFLTEILPGVDIVRDICIDWMHNVCEGTRQSFLFELHDLTEPTTLTRPFLYASKLPVFVESAPIACVRNAGMLSRQKNLYHNSVFCCRFR